MNNPISILKTFIKKNKKVKKDDFNNIIEIDNSSTILYGNNCSIKNSSIKLNNSSRLIIKDGVEIDGYDIFLLNGFLEIGKHSKLLRASQPANQRIDIYSGKLIMSNNNLIKCTFSIRFGGVCTLGEYNVINGGTEIRCDEKISMGDFNMVSYECMIYDTNTHVKYTREKRREMTIADYPDIGLENEKPQTSEVFIGNDNWFGKRAVILKGCRICNEVTVGTNAVASNLQADSAIIIGNPGTIIKKN